MPGRILAAARASAGVNFGRPQRPSTASSRLAIAGLGIRSVMAPSTIIFQRVSVARAAPRAHRATRRRSWSICLRFFARRKYQISALSGTMLGLSPPSVITECMRTFSGTCSRR